MLVQLTERNLMLSEVGVSRSSNLLYSKTIQKIEEMRITIEDLEALKELNDELEESHIETEKTLQNEIGWLVFPTCTTFLTAVSDMKDIQNRDHLQRISALEDACQDLEGTINQFRELVLQLQRYF